MTRKQIEQGVIEHFAKMTAADNVILTDQKYKGSDHYAEFEFKSDSLKYCITVSFAKPNYIKANIYFEVSHEGITNLYQQFSTHPDDEAFSIVQMNINSYLVDENRGGIYNSSDEIDLYIDEEPVDDDTDFERVASDIYNRFYSIIKNEIVPAVNSIEKLNDIFNILPYKGNNQDKPEWLIYTTFLPRQVLTGTLLAIYSDTENKTELFRKYLNYASQFEEGQKSNIDCMRNAIQSQKG